MIENGCCRLQSVSRPLHGQKGVLPFVVALVLVCVNINSCLVLCVSVASLKHTYVSVDEEASLCSIAKYIVVICVTRVAVELVFTVIVGNVGGFIILIIGFVV